MYTTPFHHSITQLDVITISRLDYVDMINLCQSDKYLSYICNDNTILRQILLITIPNLYISTNYDIAKALKELYNNINSLVIINYPEDLYYPKWINRELLINDMIKKVYIDLY